MSAAAVFDRVTPQMGEPVSDAQLSGIVEFRRATPGLVDALRTISDLRRLDDNWDTYGSPRIQHAAVERAVQVLRAADREDPPPPRVVPVSGGGLQIGWAAGARELEIEMLPDGSIEFLRAEGNEVAEAPLPPGRIDLVVPMLLGWLSGKGGRASGYGPAVTTSAVPVPQVPSRNFPFMGHFDLLALPVVEGINIDADEFVER